MHTSDRRVSYYMGRNYFDKRLKLLVKEYRALTRRRNIPLKGG